MSPGEGNSRYGGLMGLFSAAVKPKLVKPIQPPRSSLLTVQIQGTESGRGLFVWILNVLPCSIKSVQVRSRLFRDALCGIISFQIDPRPFK